LLHSFATFLHNRAKVFSIYLNIPQTKIIITSFRTTPNPFQHEVCQTIKAQIFS